jgi:hypothetical protein
MDRSDLLWLFGWWLAAALWCVTAAGRIGATFDEPTYLTLGQERGRNGSCRTLASVGTMPLPVDVQTLPLRWLPYDPDPAADWTCRLRVARAGNLLFLGLLLAAGGWLGRQFGGRWGGRIAVAGLAVEPNLLAHAALATTDLALAATLLLLVAAFRAGRLPGWGRWPKRVGVPAVCFAAAVLSKASAGVFGPFVLLAVEVERLARVRRSGLPVGREAGRGLIDLAQIGAGGLLLVVLYCGGSRPDSAERAWLRDHLPEPVSALAERLPLHRFAADALLFQWRHQQAGHAGAFLLGEWHPEPVWYYFPVALGLKLPLPLLLAPLVLGLLRPRALLNVACLAALLLLLFSTTCRVQIGVRFLLPLVALAVVGLSAAAARAAAGGGWRRRAVLAAVIGGLAWTAVEALAVWPHGLCYANELAGGPDRIHELLSDSNCDWGQGLPDLAAWQRDHADAPLAVWYFGTDPLLATLPVEPVELQRLPPEQALRAVSGRYLAVGKSMLHGPTGQIELATRLRSLQPCGRTATFLIYDLTTVRSTANLAVGIAPRCARCRSAHLGGVGE